MYIKYYIIYQLIFIPNKIKLEHKFQNYYQIIMIIYNKEKMIHQLNNYVNLIEILLNHSNIKKFYNKINYK